MVRHGDRTSTTRFGEGLFRCAEWEHSLYADEHPNFVRMDIPYTSNRPIYDYGASGEAYRREGLLLGVFFEIIFVTRFGLEFIKNDQELFEAGHVLNMGQWLSIPFILLGIYLIIRAFRRPLLPEVLKAPDEQGKKK